MAQGLGFGKKRLITNIIKENFKVEYPENKVFTFTELLYVIQEMIDEEGKQYFEKTSEERGHNVFRFFMEYLLYRNLANYDSMILLTSEKGTGKSSAAIMMARYWCSLLGITFNPKRHIAYNNSDMMRKIALLNKFEPIVADEAVRFALAAEWAKKENKELKKKLAEVRTKHLLFILCFPLKIQKVEKNYLESFTNYWVDLYARGKGAIYVKDKNPVNDTWRMKDFKNVGSYTEFTSAEQIRDKLKKHPNFWKMIKFPKPSKKLYDKYLAVREKNVYDDQNVMSSVTKEDIHKALMVMALRDIMMHDKSLSMNRIILHIKNQYDVSLTKGMVQNVVEDSKQLVTKVQEEIIKQ
jgi:hypothetical protein